MQSLCILVLLVAAYAESSVQKNMQENEIKEIEDTFDKIERNHHKLKNLFEKTVLRELAKESPEKCICVPYYLCDNGDIIKDGSQLLEFRFGTNPCRIIGDICCEPYLINTTKKALEDSKCGYVGSILTNDTSEDPKAAKFGEFPWTVLIIENSVYKCAGSLIHPKVVLTAAHCVNLTGNYTVRAGEWDASNRNEPYSHESEDVAQVLKHPKFDNNNLHYDVALLVLENPFEIKENIKTTCLAGAAPRRLRMLINDCFASGWGMDQPKTYYRRKMKKVEFSLLLHKVCQDNLRQTRVGKWFELHHSFLCGMGHNGQDVCTGDGGGPLVCPIPGQPGRFHQVGVTSWGLGCVAETPSLFAKVTQTRNWIDEQFYTLQLSTDYYTYEH